MTDVQIIDVDYTNPDHQAALIKLLNDYATDPMGGGEPLRDSVRQNLADKLAKLPHAFSVMVWVDGEPAGLANCFESFSTFSCQPIVNIHDLVVSPAYRGQQISQQLLARVEQSARQRGCCKITLEVLSGNQVAQAAYRKFGFSDYQLDPEAGHALFWQKPLS